jgi:hypothetical protein
MKELRFSIQLGEDGRFYLPEEIAAQLGPYQWVDAVFQVTEDAEDQRLWLEAAAQHFAASYGPEDAVYDDYDRLADQDEEKKP